MEFFNYLVIGLIIVNFIYISSYKKYKEKVAVIVDNAEKIKATNEQKINTDAMAEIKKIVSDPDVLLVYFENKKEYKDLHESTKAIKDYIKAVAGEQYAWDKTSNETNKVPHELNIIELGKIEFNIKDKAKTLAKKSKIFDTQINNRWTVIVIAIIVLLFLNFFRDKNLILNN